MKPIWKYGVLVAWLVLVIYRGVFDGSDQVSRWVLGILTLAVLMLAVVTLVNFIEARVGARKRGERILTNSTMAALLLVVFIVGFVLRFLVSDEPGDVVAWTGGVLGVLALGGLFALGFLRERSLADNPSFFFNPNWKYGLLLVCIAAMALFAVTESEGTLASLAVLCFWLALLVLVVRAVGRRVVIARQRSSTSSDSV